MNMALSMAESSARFAGSHGVYPVLSKFENKVNDLDELACKSLSALEDKYPVITKDGTEVCYSLA